MKNRFRRNIIKFGILGGVGNIFGISNSLGKVLNTATPAEAEGPFYPIRDQNDKDFDLTKVTGHKALADGTHIIIMGQITDIANNPVKNATIDIWQANAKGRYRHPRDANPQPLDPNFQGWAVLNSGENGKFRIKTVKPGAYPASEIWVRPPHIHFKIFKQGYAPLITQMYFPEEKLNETDLLLRNKKVSDRPLMIAKHLGKDSLIAVYEYNIVLT